MQRRGLHSQVVISPREAPSQDLQNPAVARQVLWCVFFIFFLSKWRWRTRRKHTLDEKDEDEKGEDWRWKQTMTTFFSLPFPSFFHLFLSVLAPLHRPWLWVFEASWCPTMVAVLVAMPLVSELNFVGPGAVRWLGWPSLEALKGRFSTLEATIFIYFFLGILYKFWDVLFCYDAYINLYAPFIYTYTTYQNIHNTQSICMIHVFWPGFQASQLHGVAKTPTFSTRQMWPSWGSHGYPPRCLGSLGRSGRGFEICRTFRPAVACHGCHRGCPWNWGPIFWGCEGGHEITFFIFFFGGMDLKKRSNDAKQLQIYDQFWRDLWLLLLACVWVGDGMTPCGWMWWMWMTTPSIRGESL